MGMGAQFGPIADGWVVPDMTVRIFAAGNQAHVPLLVGTNALEMSTLRVYLPKIESTVAAYQGIIERLFRTSAPALLALFPVASPAEVDPTFLALFTDLRFTCPTRFAARAMTKADAPVYLYQFTRVLPGGETLGAFHSMEIPYIFGNPQP